MKTQVIRILAAVGVLFLPCPRSYSTSPLEMWENTDFTEHILDRGKESHLGARLADLDGDGDLDIVSTGWDEPRSLHVWRNDAR